MPSPFLSLSVSLIPKASPLQYEADGLVAATAHLWLQRDVMWARHSHAYVIQYPTWPVEWVQISVLLACESRVLLVLALPCCTLLS